MAQPSDNVVGVDNTFRKKFDREEFSQRAREREEKEADGRKSKSRGPPVQRKPLKPRDYQVDLESRLGKTQVVTPIAPLSQQAGYYCPVCECVVKDSANYLDHINGKKHQRALGMSMRVERSSLEQVQQRFESLKKRKDTGSFTVQDFDERILKQQQEEEERKRQRREKKKENNFFTILSFLCSSKKIKSITKLTMQNQNPHHKNHNNISMSDTESQVSQLDSFHSPLRSDSPFRSDDPVYGPHHPTSPSKPIVTVDKYFSPAPAEERRSPVVYFSRTIREEPAPTGAVVKKVGPVGVGSGGDVEGGDVGGGQRRSTAPTSIGRSEKEAVIMNKAGLGFRICEVIFCLISFSVMAADKTQGWTGDSFYRYIEYRYCVAVNVIGFAYSGFQAFDSAYSLATRKHFISPHIRYHFDFLMDQILAYLLMSASSSAATRVDDWISNWGKDEFTEMASASIAMSFLAFLAFAFSSLISGYSLCNRSSS